MLTKEPVNARVDLARWLTLGGFPDGIVQRATKIEPSLKSKPLRPGLLEGMLVLLERKKEENVTAAVTAEFLASLKPHAELAIFSLGFKLPQILKHLYRLQEDEDGRTLLDDIEDADVLVMGGLLKLDGAEYDQIDRTIAPRGMPPARVTLLIGHKKELEQFPRIMELYESRILSL
jgi:hypothetical protein